MAFNPETAVTFLPELRDCLPNDWGYEMIEPLSNKEAGRIRTDFVKQRYKQLRGTTLSSNFSPRPSPPDLPPNRHPINIFEALKGYNSEAFDEALNIFGPVDIDIP